MAQRCEICGTNGSAKNPVSDLKEVAYLDQFDAARVNLCNSCVGRREVRSWPNSARDARRIDHAVQHHSGATHSKFVFLKDAHRVHLLRLRHSWLVNHSSPVLYRLG